MPPTRRPGQPWYASVNVDLFARLINNTILHPFICWLLPLCLRAAETPWDEPAMVNTIVWASLITVVSIYMAVDERYAYGPVREVEHEEEVIVITGGASGLGKCLAELYSMKGASVAVIDKRAPSAVEEEVDDVLYLQCDITDAAAVEKCWAKIREELGTPTVLINNAGIVNGKQMLELSTEEVARTFHTNTTAHYTLNKLFIPPILDSDYGGTIVTISSVLARLGAARLSDYTASKAALLAMHRSLEAELAPYPNIKTILVAPGQLSTDMFNGLEQSAIQNFFGPQVEVSELAMKLVKMISEGRGGVLAEPLYARWISVLELVPPGLRRVLRGLTGVDRAMEKYKPVMQESGVGGVLGSWEDVRNEKSG